MNPVKLVAAPLRAVGKLRRRSAHMTAVRNAFRAWANGRGSLVDLMSEDALVIIPGTARHCGTFRKDVFVRDVAAPFMARFLKPPTPRVTKMWSDGSDVAVMAEAEGTTLDGQPYANRYVFVLTMRRGRCVLATEFLDMTAFNDVWDRVSCA